MFMKRGLLGHVTRVDAKNSSAMLMRVLTWPNQYGCCGEMKLLFGYTQIFQNNLIIGSQL
jgi:hypothetical protein